jgi:hypothetical protein
MRAKWNCAEDLKSLILIGSQLNVPVHYDFDKSEAYIDIISEESIRQIK